MSAGVGHRIGERAGRAATFEVVQMTCGYLIYQYRVTDRARVDEIGPLVTPILRRHGGRIAIASHVKPLEGRPPTHIVVYRFESTDAAQAFHDSPEHRELDGLRHAVTEGFALAVPGFSDRSENE